MTRRSRPSMWPVAAPAVLAASYLAGSVPVANLAAKALRNVDLRDRGNGTVSGTGLYEVAGFGPLAAAGCVELAKGALGPLLAGRRRRPFLAALAAGAAVAGHDWSPFLGWRGGRGLSVAIGACLAAAPEGAAVLGAGLAGGRLAHRTGLGCAIAIAALPVVMSKTRGAPGLATGFCLAVPLVAKRLAGNERPPEPCWTTYRNRLLFDNDGTPGRPVAPRLRLRQPPVPRSRRGRSTPRLRRPSPTPQGAQRDARPVFAPYGGS